MVSHSVWKNLFKGVDEEKDSHKIEGMIMKRGIQQMDHSALQANIRGAVLGFVDSNRAASTLPLAFHPDLYWAESRPSDDVSF